MVREIITISMGQGGVQLGNAVWDQYCKEHFIAHDGTRDTERLVDSTMYNDDSFQTFFWDTQDGQFVPRNICMDLDPTTINDVRNSRQQMYHPDFLISGQEDAANNFARGHYTVGKEMIDVLIDRVRKLLDNCENPQGFILQHAIGGGTGSGLGMLLLEQLGAEYRKKTKFDFAIFPSPNLSTSIVEPYNAMMASHWLTDVADVSVVLDNEALYEICQRKLDIRTPSYNNLNRIIAKVCSSTTAALRFRGELNVDMNDFQTNLVPFPRLHFMTTSLAPILSKDSATHGYTDCRSITDLCFQSDNFLVKYPTFDVNEDKYLAISLNYRGAIGAVEANKTMYWIRDNKKVRFVSWCPTGFKLGLNDFAPPVVDGDDMAFNPLTAVMICNNVAVRTVFSRICKKADLMYSQRAYVHWYVSEGMEEGEFAEAREDLGFLEQDYLDVLNEDDDMLSDTEELSF